MSLFTLATAPPEKNATMTVILRIPINKITTRLLLSTEWLMTYIFHNAFVFML